MNKARFQGFIASLSTGETFFEYPTSKGELSAWQFLVQRCQKENITITQLQLQRGGTTVVAHPRAESYFHARQMRMSNLSKAKTGINDVQGIGSVFKDWVFINWVDNQGQVWQEIFPLKDLWVHTTRRQLVDML